MAEGVEEFETENIYHANGGTDAEDQPEHDDLLSQFVDPYGSTAWIDYDMDYHHTDISTIRAIGNKSNIAKYINTLVNEEGLIGEHMDEWKRMHAIRFIRSFLALTDGASIRPLLNNEYGHKIIRGTKFARSGKIGGFTTILSYKGVDVRKIDTTKNIVVRITGYTNREVRVEKEFNTLIAGIFRVTRELAESLSSETGSSLEVSMEVIGEDEYTEHTPEMVKEMMIEKSKHYRRPKPGERIDRLYMDLSNPTIFDGTGNDPIYLPEIPESVTRDISESSVSEISRRLHGRVEELTEQEIREFAGILDPKGNADTKIEVLDQVSNEYRLKALREADPLREQLYKNIHKTAELKSDFIRVTEKGDPPTHSEAIAVFEEEVDSNESVRDLSRLERFKK